MCFNAPVSFGSYIFGMLMAAVVLLRPASSAYYKPYDYWSVLMIISYVTVQLGEGLLHIGKDIGRQVILYSIALQPVVLSFGAAYWGKKSWFYAPTLAGLMFLPLLGFKNKVGRGPNGYLDWVFKFSSKNVEVLYSLYYFTFMFLPLFAMTPLTRFYPLIVYLAATLLYSIYNYSKSGEWSSMWCFLAIGYSALCYYVNMKK